MALSAELPPGPLTQCQAEWLGKWDEMGEIHWPHITLAAPFFSVGSYPQANDSKRRILLVGKATHQSWYMKQFLEAKGGRLAERVEERKEATIDFLEYHSEKKNSSFWAHYRTLRDAAGVSVVWTNVAKIGVCRPPDESAPINPWGPFLSAQAELAQRTLIAEIAEYKPELILLVTGKEALAEVVNPVFCPDGRWETRSTDGYSFRLVPRTDKYPAVIRTGHPSHKTREERAAWIKAAKRLLA